MYSVNDKTDYSILWKSVYCKIRDYFTWLYACLFKHKEEPVPNKSWYFSYNISGYKVNINKRMCEKSSSSYSQHCDAFLVALITPVRHSAEYLRFCFDMIHIMI